MTLAGIWEWLTGVLSWLSDSISGAWNWVIHADIVVGLEIIGVLLVGGVIIVVLIVVLDVTASVYKRLLMRLYERHPSAMRNVYLGAAGAMIIAGLAFVAAIVLSAIGVLHDGVVIVTLLLSVFTFALVALIRNPL